MSEMIITLPTPIPSGIVYDQVKVVRYAPDPENERWTALIYGICQGQIMPFIVQCASGSIVRVEEFNISYDAIVAAQANQSKAYGVIDEAVLTEAGMSSLATFIGSH